MSLLVVDAASEEWSLFDPVSLRVEKHGRGKLRAGNSVTKAGLIVQNLPGQRGLAKASEVKTGLTDGEKAFVKSLARYQPLWLISDRAFFDGLPIEVTAAGMPDIRDGLIHASLLEEAAKSLGRPTQQLNLITLFLDRDSSVVAIRGGVPVEITTALSPQPDLVTWSGMKGTLKEILGKPKLRLNPKFQLGLRVYFHQLILLVGADAGLLGRLDAVVLSGALGEEDLTREELLRRLPFLQSVNILVGQPNPLGVAAATLHRL